MAVSLASVVITLDMETSQVTELSIDTHIVEESLFTRDRLYFINTVHAPKRSTAQQEIQHQHNQVVKHHLVREASAEIAELACWELDYYKRVVSKI
ncbi:hypothetical protein LguiB_024381 [Lonicera macranthoides]